MYILNEYCKRDIKNYDCDSFAIININTIKYLSLHINDRLKWNVHILINEQLT